MRYQATETEKGSKLIVLPLAARAPAPVVTYDSTAEVISGLSSEMEVRRNEGNYTPITDLTLNIANEITSIPENGILTISTRKRATQTTQPGLDRVITVYPRSSTPTTVKFNPILTTLSGYTTAM